MLWFVFTVYLLGSVNVPLYFEILENTCGWPSLPSFASSFLPCVLNGLILKGAKKLTGNREKFTVLLLFVVNCL